MLITSPDTSGARHLSLGHVNGGGASRMKGTPGFLWISRKFSQNFPRLTNVYFFVAPPLLHHPYPPFSTPSRPASPHPSPATAEAGEGRRAKFRWTSFSRKRKKRKFVDASEFAYGSPKLPIHTLYIMFKFKFS